MQVVVISGLSGSGKSIALAVLEDAGYYCIDNLPVKLLAEACELIAQSGSTRMAVAIDARSGDGLRNLPDHIESLRDAGLDARLLFLDARDETLMRRFSETRRRHPLATDDATLEESLIRERELLSAVAESASVTRMDTSQLHPNTLRAWIRDMLAVAPGRPTLMFESFGYKQGVPLDADMVFDVRVLPNPFYDPRLRPMTGRDRDVAEFLEKDPSVIKMLADIAAFVEAWLPSFARDNRSSLTVALGCTGGQHRSVFLAERLAAHFRATSPVLVRHRQLPQ
jgi:UPF0042 nucleotide-binding protein